MTYSCAASWLATYKVGLLGADRRRPARPRGVARLRPTRLREQSQSTFGVGHGSFVDVDGPVVVRLPLQDRHPRRLAAHASTSSRSTSRPAAPRCSGAPVHAVRTLPVPTGQPWTPRSDAAHLGRSRQDGVDDFDYYGHHQFFAVSDAGLDLGCIPTEPVNDFRSAEKFVLRDGDYDRRHGRGHRSTCSTHSARSASCSGPPARASGSTRSVATSPASRSTPTTCVLGRTDGEEWTTIGDGQRCRRA